MGGVGSGRKSNISEEEKKRRKADIQKKWKQKNLKFYQQKQKELAKKNKEKYRLSRKNWETKNRDKFLETKKRWRDNNKDKIHETYRKWYEKKKQKELKHFLSIMKYERKHPGRSLKYYYANRERLLARQNERNKTRRKKAA